MLQFTVLWLQTIMLWFYKSWGNTRAMVPGLMLFSSMGLLVIRVIQGHIWCPLVRFWAAKHLIVSFSAKTSRRLPSCLPRLAPPLMPAYCWVNFPVLPAPAVPSVFPAVLHLWVTYINTRGFLLSKASVLFLLGWASNCDQDVWPKGFCALGVSWVFLFLCLVLL